MVGGMLLYRKPELGPESEITLQPHRTVLEIRLNNKCKVSVT